MRFFHVIIFFFIVTLNLNAQHNLAGTWVGNLKVGAVSLRLVFNIIVAADSLHVTLDSPDQGAKGIKCDDAQVQLDTVLIKVPVIGGSYSGLILPGDSVMDGNWKQGGLVFPLVLFKSSSGFVLNRPQEPKPPFDYKSENVTFKSLTGNFSLSGTLTIPQGDGPFSAVVLVTGSGPQNRDEELMGHKPFLVLADYLTRNGIAVLRYDDRGVGKSEGEFSTATTFDFADDAESAFNFLKTRNEVYLNRIGILGHSEGGIVAPIVASRNQHVAFIVLLAAPGTDGQTILQDQTVLISRKSGVSELEIDNNTLVNKDLYELLAKEKDTGVLNGKLKAYLLEVAKNDTTMNAAEKDQFIKSIDSQVIKLTSRWFKTFISLNPATFLQKVTCPVYALNGENDLQVPCDKNQAGIREALQKNHNNAVKIERFSGLNHLFQHSASGLPSEYGEIEQTIAPEVLTKITEWIKSM